jgi:hypothetical protein
VEFPDGSKIIYNN